MTDPLRELQAIATRLPPSAADGPRRHSISNDDVSVLSKLIDQAGLALRGQRSPEPELVGAIGDLVVQGALRPTDSVRVIHDYTVLCAAAIASADACLHRFDQKGATVYARAIGALLPDIKSDLVQALENRVRPTA